MSLEKIHSTLIEKKLTLATAESCTGGALAARFVTMAGASNYYVGSIVAYTNRVKERLLDIDSALLEQHGAVSEEVTAEMALHVSEKLEAMLAIAVSGSLGPASDSKPVGTVAVSIAYKNQIALSWTMHHSGTRLEILEKVIDEILRKLERFLDTL